MSFHLAVHPCRLPPPQFSKLPPGGGRQEALESLQKAAAQSSAAAATAARALAKAEEAGTVTAADLADLQALRLRADAAAAEAAAAAETPAGLLRYTVTVAAASSSKGDATCCESTPFRTTICPFPYCVWILSFRAANEQIVRARLWGSALQNVKHISSHVGFAEQQVGAAGGGRRRRRRGASSFPKRWTVGPPSTCALLSSSFPHSLGLLPLECSCRCCSMSRCSKTCGYKLRHRTVANMDGGCCQNGIAEEA